MMLSRIAPLTVGLALLLLAACGGSPAAAATCSDYPNQTAAQRAANTHDGDGDGVYCESLPCPCSKDAAGTSPTGPTAPTKPQILGLGKTIRLAPWRRRYNCRVRGPLPDGDCTPGTRFDGATKRRICTSGYARQVRNVPAAVKRRVYAMYGMSTGFDGTNGQLDHLVSLELGGTNSMANLWPQAASRYFGAKQKDRLENRLHDEVCAGRLTLRQAQLKEARDWVSAYRRRFL
ncbi:unannotated protein [freshwater metagenome]|uniref:Unannotated protein n=1 Tax=freshwater metagenome TaxID=449393 RepID=A0A6J7J1W6_9ZZZZ|nr:hypothetical protein [Actinomycetota bacterium]